MDPPPPPPAGPPGAPSEPPPPAAPGWSPPGAPGWAPPPPQRHLKRGWALIAMAGIVVVVAAVLVVIGAATGSNTSNNGSTSGTAFTDPTNHFSATFHNKPAAQNDSTTVGGRAISQVQWTDVIDSNTAEIIGYADFPADFNIADPHNALDASVNGEVSNTNGSLVTKTFGTYQGFSSVDAVISVSDGFAETRAVLAGRTLYIVVVTGQDDPPNLFGGFANSLHILTHAG